jgi:membrane-bound metal-dependent hydrolase YbcI (DUF457 family)
MGGYLNPLELLQPEARAAIQRMLDRSNPAMFANPSGSMSARKAKMGATTVSRKHRGWGHRLLPRFKRIDGKLYQLHATKGWRRALE